MRGHGSLSLAYRQILKRSIRSSNWLSIIVLARLMQQPAFQPGTHWRQTSRRQSIAPRCNTQQIFNRLGIENGINPSFQLLDAGLIDPRLRPAGNCPILSDDLPFEHLAGNFLASFLPPLLQSLLQTLLEPAIRPQFPFFSQHHADSLQPRGLCP